MTTDIELPHHLLLEVFDKLELHDKLSARLVSKEWSREASKCISRCIVTERSLVQQQRYRTRSKPSRTDVYATNYPPEDACPLAPPVQQLPSIFPNITSFALWIKAKGADKVAGKSQIAQAFNTLSGLRLLQQLDVELDVKHVGAKPQMQVSWPGSVHGFVGMIQSSRAESAVLQQNYAWVVHTVYFGNLGIIFES